MFERFTGQARRVVVLAQEEARGLQHNYIGTEHFLLALLSEEGGPAARALGRFGMSRDEVRDEVTARVGLGKGMPSGHIPFTPRAKKILEFALRESQRLGHGYIGTEHVLLGLIREGDGVGADIIKTHAGDLMAARMAVLDLLPAPHPAAGIRWLRRRGPAVPAPGQGAAGTPQGEAGVSHLSPDDPDEELRTTPAADASLDEARRLAGTQPVGSHHLLLAALADSNTAAARVIAALGLDLDQAREALRRADVTGTSDELPEEAGRRHMVIRVTEDRLTIEVTDPVVVRLGRTAVEALGERASEPGAISGDLPVSNSLSNVWLALRDSLDDIRRRAGQAAA